MNFIPDLTPTMGVDCFTKSYKHESNVLVDLAIWDLAGQILYRDLATSYSKGSDLVIIVFDVTQRQTFESVKGWYETIFNVIGKDESKVTPCMIIGNKIDLRDKRVVEMDEGLEVTSKLDALYVETSAKEGQGVDEAFNHLIVEYIKISKFF